nr:uncharacterized protein LOC109774673 [Aegilops tauschii subsp. strangulata]
MVSGRGRAPAAAATPRVPPRERGRSPAVADVGPSGYGRGSTHGRGRGGRGARGRGGRGGAAALPPQAGNHSVEAVCEFIVDMHRWPCTWLRLPDSFATEMADRAPLGLWVQADG